MGNLKHSIFQTEVEFNAPIRRGHISGLDYRESSHPQGNPTDTWNTWIIHKHPRTGRIQTGRTNPNYAVWRPATDTIQVFNNVNEAKVFARNVQGGHWIDTVSPKNAEKVKREKQIAAKRKRSMRQRLKSMRKKLKW